MSQATFFVPEHTFLNPASLKAGGGEGGGGGGGGGGAPEPRRHDVPRVLAPGASLADLLVPGRVVSYKRETRRQGDASIYSNELTPNRPFQFSLGVFAAPRNQATLITSWKVSIFTYSGVAARDTRRVDDGNLSTFLGVSIGVGGNPFMDNESEIAPVIISPEDASAARYAQGDAFYAAAAANSISSASVRGKGLFPYQNGYEGRDDGPFHILVQSDSIALNFGISVFEPLSLPVAYFDLEVRGYVLTQSDAQELLRRLTLAQ